MTTTTTATPLQFDPIEWLELDISWKRSDNFQGGLFRNYVTALTLVKDGATIFRYLYYTQGEDAVAIFATDWREDDSGPYTQFFEGNPDFSKAVDSPVSFQTALLDAGIEAILAAKRSVPYEIPLLDSDCLSVFHDGILMNGYARYVVPEQGVASPIALSNSFGIYSSGVEGISGATVFDASSQLIPADLSVAHNKIYTTTIAETVTVTGKFTINVFWPSAASSNVWPTIMVQHTGGIAVLYQAAASLAPGQSATYVINNSTSFALAAGASLQVIVLMMNASGSGGTPLDSASARFKVLGQGGTIEIRSQYQRPPSLIRAYRQKQVWQKVIDQILGPGYSVVSNHLNTPSLTLADSKPYNTLITCGDAVRGLGDGASNPAKIVVSLDELQDDLSARDMGGVGVEGNTLRVERLPYFYDNSTVIVDLGLVTDFEVVPSSDDLYNQLSIGYEPRSNDSLENSLNGKDDFANTNKYSTPSIHQTNKLELVSPFVASPWVTEYMRANMANKKTTDTKTDNEIFLMEVEDSMSMVQVTPISTPVPAYKLSRRQNISGNSATGILSPATVYNIGLSARRCLTRNEPRLRAPYALQPGWMLDYQTADKNPNLQSNLGSGLVVESADVPFSGMAGILYHTKLFKFKAPITQDIPTLIALNPYGRVNFRAMIKGVEVALGGFIINASMKPADNEPQQWVLKPCPDIDLGTIVH